jgi:hypothetical protein
MKKNIRRWKPLPEDSWRQSKLWRPEQAVKNYICDKVWIREMVINTCNIGLQEYIKQITIQASPIVTQSRDNIFAYMKDWKKQQIS